MAPAGGFGGLIASIRSRWAASTPYSWSSDRDFFWDELAALIREVRLLRTLEYDPDEQRKLKARLDALVRLERLVDRATAPKVARFHEMNLPSPANGLNLKAVRSGEYTACLLVVPSEKVVHGLIVYEGDLTEEVLERIRVRTAAFVPVVPKPEGTPPHAPDEGKQP